MYIIKDFRLSDASCFGVSCDLIRVVLYDLTEQNKMFLITLGSSTRPQEHKSHLFPSTRCCSAHEDKRDLTRATAFASPRATAAQRTSKSTSSPATSKRL